MKVRSQSDLYAFLLQNYQGLTIEKLALMSDDQKALYVRRLEEVRAGGRGAALTPRQACINRWVGKHGMSLEAARKRWHDAMGDSEG